MSKDPRGDYLKSVEQEEAGRRADRESVIMCRLDGKSFHTFTRGLRRPYDQRLSSLMIDTTKYLVAESGALVGYTQSDEISLCWKLNLDKNPEASFPYDGKYQKIASIMASMAGAFFNKNLEKYLPEKVDTLPVFDARVWSVSDLDEALSNFQWRQNDAIKNSITMAAQAHWNHRKLHGVGSEKKKQMLREIGQPWEVMPTAFKMGSFVKRKSYEVQMTNSELASIPEKHRPNGPITRSRIEVLDIEYLDNCVDVYAQLFEKG